jgi:uncharacterized protein
MGIFNLFRSQDKVDKELFVASMLGDYNHVKRYIKKEANVNVLYHHENRKLKLSPLIVAVISNHIDIVSLLLENGADINLSDNTKRCPLHYAAIYGHIELVNLLLENGADPLKTDSSNLTPEQLAKKYSHLEIASILKVKA